MSLRPTPPTAYPSVDSAAALALLGDAVSDAVLLGDGEFEITHANPAACRLLDRTVAELVGRPLDGLFPTHARSTIRKAARDGGAFVLDAEGAAPHPLVGRRCSLHQVGDGVALVIAPDAAPSISNIVRQLNQTLEFERIVDLVARHAVELLRARRAAVFVLEGDALVVVGRSGPALISVGERIPLGESFSGAAIRALRPVRLSDARGAADRWPALAADIARDARPCVIAAPLVIGGRPIGAVCVAGRDDVTHSGTPGSGDPGFDAADERLLGKLADHAAIAVENARLYSAAARTARHASILAETAREIVRHVTPRALYAGVARVALHALRADGVCVYLTDADSRSVEVAHCEGALAGEEPGALAYRFWSGTAGQAAQSGVPRFVPDSRAGSASAAADCGCQAPDDVKGGGAIALLPLTVEGRTRGVLALHYLQPQPFDEAERRLLGDFATQAAIGLRNASLVAALERRAARLAALARAQQEIPRTTLGEVYAELHAAVSAVVDAPCFALLTAGDEGGAPTSHQMVAHQVVAHHVVVDGRSVPPTELPASAAAAAAEAVRTERPVFEQPPLWSWSAAAAPEPGREWRPAASGLAVPVRHGGRVLGALHVQSYTQNAYAAEEADLLAIVAGHAGAALELARLFLLKQRERELSEATAEVARLALGDDDLPTVAGALVRVVERIVPTTAMVLAALTDPETVKYLACTGDAVRLTGTRVPFAESVVSRLQPGGELVVPDIQALVAPPWRALAPDGRAVFIPLVARQRVIGMLAAGTPHGAHLSEMHLAELRHLAASVALAMDALLLGEEERRVAEQLRQHEKLAALGSLVAGVAHELNNPLTGISAFSQLLLEEGLEDEQTEAVRLIKREADRAVGVIRDLLIFARKTGAAFGEVDVGSVIQLAVRLRAYALRAERIEVVLDLDESAPRTVGDEQRLQQVFLNLIVNAEQAMSGRDERRLTLRTRRADAHLVVEVTDTGSGMAAGTLAHAFEPFFTTKPAGTGTGLGLSVSYGIVQAHGGTITAKSAPGQGTTFRITLPLARQDELSESVCL